MNTVPSRPVVPVVIKVAPVVIKVVPEAKVAKVAPVEKTGPAEAKEIRVTRVDPTKEKEDQGRQAPADLADLAVDPAVLVASAPCRRSSQRSISTRTASLMPMKSPKPPSR